MPFVGEGTISYNYVRTRYKWEVDEYSTYQSITTASGIVGQAIFIPLAAMLGVNEAWIMTIVFGSIMLRHLIAGLAVEPWMYYFATLMDIVGSYAMSIMRSMLSTCVAPNELGKVYAFLSALESLLPIGIVQAYASIRGRQIFFRGGVSHFRGGGEFVDPIFNGQFFSKKKKFKIYFPKNKK
jgi:hypothetical protein